MELEASLQDLDEVVALEPRNDVAVAKRKAVSEALSAAKAAVREGGAGAGEGCCLWRCRNLFLVDAIPARRWPRGAAMACRGMWHQAPPIVTTHDETAAERASAERIGTAHAPSTRYALDATPNNEQRRRRRKRRRAGTRATSPRRTRPRPPGARLWPKVTWTRPRSCIRKRWTRGPGTRQQGTTEL